MSCRRTMRWVLRHGVADIPAEWQDHIDGCAKCREFIANINALDNALSKGDGPDPGKAYWEGFAPSVARRLDELQNAPVRTPVRGRWAWTRTWAPAIGVAALALLIGRELSRDHTTRPAIMDSDVSVATQVTPSTSDNVAGQAADQPTPDGNILAEKSASGQKPAASIAEAEHTRVHSQPHQGATLAAQPGQKDLGESDSESEMPGNVVNELDMGSMQESEIPELAQRRSADIINREDESSVWPDRRVQTLGQLGQDASEQPTLDDARLKEQSSPGLAEHRSWAATGAETSGTPSPLARLEGRQTFRSATLPDSQSPTEAMRRFDELDRLRVEIADLEAIDASARTQDQSRDLCAMWYRAGKITLDPAELDRAIQRMDKYIAELSGALRLEWLEKKSQLVSRRASFDR